MTRLRDSHKKKNLLNSEICNPVGPQSKDFFLSEKRDKYLKTFQTTKTNGGTWR